VPRQVLNTMMAAIGYSTSQAVLPPSTALTVPASRSSIAIHRNATTELGSTQASSTSACTTRRSAGAVARNEYASRKPSTFCPITAEPSTNSRVSQSEL